MPESHGLGRRTRHQTMDDPTALQTNAATRNIQFSGIRGALLAVVSTVGTYLHTFHPSGNRGRHLLLPDRKTFLRLVDEEAGSLESFRTMGTRRDTNDAGFSDLDDARTMDDRDGTEVPPSPQGLHGYPSHPLLRFLLPDLVFEGTDRLTVALGLPGDTGEYHYCAALGPRCPPAEGGYVGGLFDHLHENTSIDRCPSPERVHGFIVLTPIHRP